MEISTALRLIRELYRKTLDSLARKTNQTTKELFDEMKGIIGDSELDFDFFFVSVLMLMQENKRIVVFLPPGKGQEEALVCLVSQQPH